MKKLMVKKAIVSVLLSLALSATVYAGTFAAGASYKNWSQSDSSWGYIKLGDSGKNMSQIGCFVTSIAMLMKHSGVVTDPNFTPGVLAAYYNKIGAFGASGDLAWAAVEKYNKNFAFHKTELLSGSKEQKVRQIKNWLDKGYYVMVSVKNGNHFVAVDHISGSTVYIMDPARASDELFGYYDGNGINSIRIFKTNKSGTPTTSAPPIPDLEPPPLPKQNQTAAPPAPDPETPPAPVQHVTKPVSPPAPDPETPPAPVQHVTQPVLPSAPDPATPPVPVQEAESMTETLPAPDPETPPSPGMPETDDIPAAEMPLEDTAEELLPPPMPSQVGTSDTAYFYVSMNVLADEMLVVYRLPDSDSQVLYMLPEGTQLRLLLVSEDLTWGLTEYDGSMCWILLEHVKY